MTDNPKNEYYKFFTDNLYMVDMQMSLIKNMINELYGELYWKKNNNNDNLSETEYRIKSLTRLYTFLIGNQLEIYLNKIINDKSSAAFSSKEIEDIHNKKQISEKWKEAFNITYKKMPINNQRLLDIKSEINQNFSSNYFSEIDDIILTRNRLAHGQWDEQLNAKGKLTDNKPEILKNYTKINELVLLKNKLKCIVNLLELLIVYKDKCEPRFEINVKKYINEIKNINNRIAKSNIENYTKKYVNKYQKEHLNFYNNYHS